MAYREMKIGLISPYSPKIKRVCGISPSVDHLDEKGFGNRVAVAHHCSVWKINARLNDCKLLTILLSHLLFGPLTPLGFLRSNYSFRR